METLTEDEKYKSLWGDFTEMFKLSKEILKIKKDTIKKEMFERSCYLRVKKND